MEFLGDKKDLNTNYRKWKWSNTEIKWYEKLCMRQNGAFTSKKAPQRIETEERYNKNICY